MNPDDDQLETAAVSGNLFPPILGLLGIGLLAFAGWALGMTGQSDELSRCNPIANDQARLACYDKVAVPRQPAKGAFGFLPQDPQERSR
jgi:hypothetical protein